MRNGFKLGRLFGIDFNVDWSWAFVFVLMTWNLTALFVSWHPAWPTAGAFALAVVAALLFFGSVLLHELAHALVARGYGLPVHQIRLFLFGGVSYIERTPATPAAEFWIAIAGPLLSLGLGVVLMLLAGAILPTFDVAHPATTLAALGPIGTLVVWLGPTNLVVGAFNLLPGLPLDGGHLLRAAVASVTGDQRRATVIAAAAGRAIGLALIAIGVAMVFGVHVPLFGTGSGGMWLALVGWFLRSAADQTVDAYLIHEALQGVRVEQLMRRSGPALTEDTSLRRAVREWFLRSEDRAFPVVSDGQLLGMLSIDDVKKLPEAQWAIMPVGRVMTPRAALTVVEPTLEAEVALHKLGESSVDQLPVVHHDELVGMLSRLDLARWLELHVAQRSVFSHA